MADWSSAHRDVLEKIGEKFDSHIDYVKFRAVCMAWRSSLPEKPKPLHVGLPSLVLPPKHHKQQHQQDFSYQTRGFFSLYDQKIYPLQLPEVMMEKGLVFRGSSHGWIVAVNKSPNIYLINPTLCQSFQLPPVTTFPEVVAYQPPDKDDELYYLKFLCLEGEYYIRKVVLSSSPSYSKDYIAMAICGQGSYLAFCKGGDQQWTVMDKKKIDGYYSSYTDIMFYQDKFYAVDNRELVFVISLADLQEYSSSSQFFSTMPVRISPYPPKEVSRPRPQAWYLVESSGDLLMVTRHIDFSKSAYRTTCFKVFKLNLTSRNSYTSWGKWSKKKEKSLGDKVLFLGDNNSLCLPSHRLPASRGNCIYFTDNYLDGHDEGKRGGADIGVFDYKNKTICPLPGYKHHSQLVWPPPIWFIPN